MNKKENIVISWSGGKDSAYALHQIIKEGQYNVKYLLTNIFKPSKRVSMHGVPESLIEKQANSLGIPLIKLYIEEKTHDEYALKMKETLLQFKSEGILKVAFGDIFLEDLKIYREQKLAEIEMEALFPLWENDTHKLALQFINEGFKTHICSIDTSKIAKNLIGIDFSESFLKQLKPEIDPCGENGEFHSFCYDGPIFKNPVLFQKNGSILKTYHHNNKPYEYLFSDIS